MHALWKLWKLETIAKRGSLAHLIKQSTGGEVAVESKRNKYILTEGRVDGWLARSRRLHFRPLTRLVVKSFVLYEHTNDN